MWKLSERFGIQSRLSLSLSLSRAMLFVQHRQRHRLVRTTRTQKVHSMIQRPSRSIPPLHVNHSEQTRSNKYPQEHDRQKFHMQLHRVHVTYSEWIAVSPSSVPPRRTVSLIPSSILYRAHVCTRTLANTRPRPCAHRSRRSHRR